MIVTMFLKSGLKYFNMEHVHGMGYSKKSGSAGEGEKFTFLGWGCEKVSFLGRGEKLTFLGGGV